MAEKNIAGLKTIIAEQHISNTVSIGASQWHSDSFSSAESFVEHADKSLYQAKKTGRNKVVVSQLAQDSH